MLLHYKCPLLTGVHFVFGSFESYVNLVLIVLTHNLIIAEMFSSILILHIAYEVDLAPSNTFILVMS